MNIFRKILLVATALVFATGAWAQNSRTIKERLALPDPGNSSRIVVTEKGDAASIVRMLESARTSNKIKGYRVRIYFDNSQDARNGAFAAQSKFKELFPDTPSYLTYDPPYFKVAVGNCLTNEEAVILWGQIKGVFDKAYVMQEEFSVDALAE